MLSAELVSNISTKIIASWNKNPHYNINYILEIFICQILPQQFTFLSYIKKLYIFIFRFDIVKS